MRIAHVSHLSSPGAPTGAERVLVEIAAGLAGRGHEVAVASPGAGRAAADLERMGIRTEIQPLRQCWLTQPRPEAVVLDALRLARWAAPGSGGGRFRRWLRDFCPDVVHVNCLPNVTAAAAATARGLPVLWHVHEIVAPGWRRRFFTVRLKRYSARVVAVSEAVAAWLRTEGIGAKVTVVHNGVAAPAAPRDRNELRRRYGLPVDAVLVGCFGQLIPHKGVLDLIAAADRLDPGVGVVVAGSGSARFVDEVRRRIADGPGTGRAWLLPPEPDAWDLLATVDVVAVPSRWPDPLPRIVMEAMAVGRPVVASDCGGIPEMVVDGETGILFPPGDVGALADSLRCLTADAERRRVMGTAGARRAQREFSLERHVSRMEALFAEVLTERGDGMTGR